jgi:hypothetical protein
MRGGRPSSSRTYEYARFAPKTLTRGGEGMFRAANSYRESVPGRSKCFWAPESRGWGRTSQSRRAAAADAAPRLAPGGEVIHAPPCMFPGRVYRKYTGARGSDAAAGGWPRRRRPRPA